ncbi:MAG: hypothetical protein QXK06_03370 [Candidatus Diapherotrites archaeon]
MPRTAVLKPGFKRISVEVPVEVARTLEIIARLEDKDLKDLLVGALKDFVPREIEQNQLDKHALYRFLDSRLSYEDLVLIIGKEKAEAASHTQNIRGKAKEFLKTLEE